MLRALWPATPRVPRRRRAAAEAQLLAPARPGARWRIPSRPVGGAIELALADGAGGLFLCGWLRDPLDLVGRARAARRHSPAAPCPPGRCIALARPELAEAFARTALRRRRSAGPASSPICPTPTTRPSAQWRLALRLGSGEALYLIAPPSRCAPAAARDLVLRAVHPAALRPGLLERCIAPAAARLHRAAMREGGARRRR